jgi:hypothetical protein
MTVKFIHLRRRDPLWGFLEPTGGITVAYDIEPDGRVRYVHAQCSNKDHYNKRIGRMVSTGRLANNGWTDQRGIRHDALTFMKVEGVNIVEQILKHHDALAA